MLHLCLCLSFSPLGVLSEDEILVLLTELRLTAMEEVKKWRPVKPEIVPKKAKIIKWILKPDNMHKFKNLQTPRSTAKASVWKGLVDELFPQFRKPADLIKYFATASSRPQFIGNFVEEVVRVHGRLCTLCTPE